MQRIKTVSVLLFPPILIGVLSFALQGGKDILSGIYFIFPIIFLFQALFSKHIAVFLCGMLLSAFSFLVTVRLFYHMGTCFDLAIFYLLIGGIAYFSRQLVQKRRAKHRASS